MGVLQRFERRLEGLVEGTFARVFGGVVQPVEVASALQREAADHKAVVGRGRVLVPNSYVVELGPSDHERLGAYDGALRRELAGMLSEHAAEQGWSFVGAVGVHLEKVDDLGTGVFRVRSAVAEHDDGRPQPAPRPAAPMDAYRGAAAGAPPRRVSPEEAGPRLILEGAVERVVPLTSPLTVLGRAADADLRLPDTGVSRAHAEIRLADGVATVTDLGSTNGTTVNGRRISNAELRDGDRLGVGASTLVYRSGR